MYQLGAKVRYSFTFNTGATDFPDGSQLTLMTAPESIVPSSFVCSTGGGASVTSGSAIPHTALKKGITYDCQFDVVVTSNHRALGRIDEFNITLAGSSDLTDAFFVPKIPTTVVPVHTGASLSYTSYSVDTQTHTRKWESGRAS